MEHLHFPAHLTPWITCRSSLTAMLKEQEGDARLQVVSHQWEKPDKWDSEVLKIQEEDVLHRNILMRTGNTPCWYARTIVPFSCYCEHPLLFSRLEQESLGQLIFDSVNEIERIDLTIYSVSFESLEYHWLPLELSQNAELIWMRLSSFAIRRTSPFFLAELFLPAFLELLCDA